MGMKSSNKTVNDESIRIPMVTRKAVLKIVNRGISNTIRYNIQALNMTTMIQLFLNTGGISSRAKTGEKYIKPFKRKKYRIQYTIQD
jgi:hypothetical protein